jgi:hypothetical protein
MTKEIPNLNDLGESAVDWRADWGNLLPEVDGSNGTLGNSLWGELELLVDLLVWTGSTESVETELLMRVLLPSESGHDLNGEDWDSVRKDRESVLLGLDVEQLPAWKRDDAGNDAVVLLEVLGGINGDGNFGTGGDKGDLGVLILKSNVSSLGGLLDGRLLELWEVLAGESNDGWCLLGSEGNVVGSRSLVTISWTPHLHVWKSTEMREGLDRLMGWSILTKSDRVVGGDPDVADAGKGREADRSSSVGNEVQEGTGVWDDVSSVGGETVHDSTHGVFTDTIADVTTSPVSELGRWWLEIKGILPAGKIGASQIGGTTDELWDDLSELGENSLGKLAGSNSWVAWLVGWEGLLPSLWKFTLETASELCTLSWEFLLVLLEGLVPLFLKSGTLSSLLSVQFVNLLWDIEGLGWVETELLLDGSSIIFLERVTVNTVGSLKLGSETNGGGELDDGWLVGNGLGDLDRLLNSLQVVVTIHHPLCVPSIGLKSLEDILSERAVGITING